MADQMGIPDRSVFKASEVCEIARIQPYVLRTWESEFPSLGVPRTSGGRLYRRTDVEQVLRIRRLVFEEGLTLAGARRRLEQERAPQPDLPLEDLVAPEVRDRIVRVRQGLRDLLAMLGGKPAPGGLMGGGNGNDATLPPQAEPAQAPEPSTQKRRRRARSRRARDGGPGILDPGGPSQ